MQLQFLRFSELILHKLFVGWYIYIHIYIYVYIVELKVGPRLWVFRVRNWSKSCVKKLVQDLSPLCPYLSSQIMLFGSKIVFSQDCHDVGVGFRKDNCIFCFCCLFMLEKDRQKH